jgi:hypothetical protein
MASDLELSLFEQELVEVRDLPEASRWLLERDGSVSLGLLVTMHPLGNPEEFYLARLRWGSLFQPPSLKFLRRDTGADNDPAAWPQCRGFRPAQLDACVSWTAEGHALHPEWASSPKAMFRSPEKAVQFVLLLLQNELDGSYAGRGHR